MSDPMTVVRGKGEYNHSKLAIRAGLKLLAACALACVLAGSGCGGGGAPLPAPPTLTTITVTPDSCVLDVGETQVFVATGYDQYDDEIDILPVWTVEGGIGNFVAAPAATTSIRHFSANISGQGKVQAMQGAVVGEASVTVVTPGTRVLTTITMEPASATLQVGATQDITASGFDQHGDPIDFDAVWSVEGDIGSVAPAMAPAAVTSTYRFTATAVGSGSVRATDGDVFGQTDIQVTEATAGLTNLFFLHHSTGNGMIVQGSMRAHIAAYNADNATSYTFWDHGYNGEGLRNPAGVWTNTSYSIPDDNTDPDGLHALWTTNNSARTSIMANHEVIAFKSCFPASAIGDNATLEQYKTWYREMRNYFDAHPERLFVVMSTPPLHQLSTDTTEADNARAFADWLKSAEYLAGHTNVICFDLFDALAQADDGSPTRNMLRYEYEMSHGDGDSHPNALANQTVGPVFADFLIDAAQSYSP